MCDVLGMCKFHTEWLGNPMTMKMMAELFSAVTGVEMDEDGLFEVAARVNNVERAYLVREGITRKDDIISGRAMDEPVPTGIHKGKKLTRRNLPACWTSIMRLWDGIKRRDSQNDRPLNHWD